MSSRLWKYLPFCFSCVESKQPKLGLYMNLFLSFVGVLVHYDMLLFVLYIDFTPADQMANTEMH